MRYLVGIDDSDSQFGLCTTFLGYRIVLKLLEGECSISSYPRLVRLNPNIPFKTRGNAAICIEFESQDVDANFENICSLVESYSDVANGANTGVVLIDVRPPPYFGRLYQRALSGLVNKEGVLKSLPAVGARVFTLGNGMGVVGASASVGFEPLQDHTYELLAYRRQDACGSRREVNAESVKSMDKLSFPHTYNNYDYESERVMITPHGADPVLLGIRGDSPRTVLRAFSSISCSEEVEGHIIYVTNQHTDAHISHQLGFPLKVFSSGWVQGRVSQLETGAGAHVYFVLDAGIETVRCAVYEPTGDLRRIARLLRTGDVLRVAGGVRKPSTKHPRLINVEKIEVISLQKQVEQSNPTCRKCGLRMKSMGRDNGMRCTECKTRIAGGKISRLLERRLERGTYIPSPRSQRHLTKQLIRYGRELDGRNSAIIDGWIHTQIVRSFAGLARSP